MRFWHTGTDGFLVISSMFVSAAREVLQQFDEVETEIRA